jgi:hypothetical protein
MIITDALHVFTLCVCCGLLGAVLASLVGRARRP